MPAPKTVKSAWLIVARKTGASLLGARHDVSPPGENLAAQKTLAAGQKFPGALLNAFDPGRARAGQGYGYGYRNNHTRRDRDSEKVAAVTDP